MQLIIKSALSGALSFTPGSLEAEMRQDIMILLDTPKGSVPFYREFGMDMSYISAPMPLAQTMYASAASEAIRRFIPGARLQSVAFDTDAADSTKTHPALEVQVNE